MPSMKTNVIMLAVGCFLLGAVLGILVYDSTWGAGDTLIRISESYNAQSYAIVYGIISSIATLLIVYGVINLFYKKQQNNP